MKAQGRSSRYLAMSLRGSYKLSRMLITFCDRGGGSLGMMYVLPGPDCASSSETQRLRRDRSHTRGMEMQGVPRSTRQSAERARGEHWRAAGGGGEEEPRPCDQYLPLCAPSLTCHCAPAPHAASPVTLPVSSSLTCAGILCSDLGASRGEHELRAAPLATQPGPQRARPQFGGAVPPCTRACSPQTRPPFVEAAAGARARSRPPMTHALWVQLPYNETI